MWTMWITRCTTPFFRNSWFFGLWITFPFLLRDFDDKTTNNYKFCALFINSGFIIFSDIIHAPHPDFYLAIPFTPLTFLCQIHFLIICNYFVL